MKDDQKVVGTFVANPSNAAVVRFGAKRSDRINILRITSEARSIIWKGSMPLCCVARILPKLNLLMWNRWSQRLYKKVPMGV